MNISLSSSCYNITVSCLKHSDSLMAHGLHVYMWVIQKGSICERWCICSSSGDEDSI